MSMFRWFHFSVTTLAAVSALELTIVSSAAAQSAQQPSGLEEVIVTAQKRSERLQDVPIAITAIGSEALEKAGVQRLDDISALTPGLQFQHTGGFTQPMIRGVGTSIAGAGAGANVGMYVDGFLLPNPLGTDMQMLNISSVQVLKGPQGTLFGRNTTGGAILLTTTNPSTDPAFKGEVSYGTDNAQGYQAYATAGLADRVAFDVAGLYRSGDGSVRNLVSGKKDNEYENWSVRAGLKVDFTDSFYALLRYTHSQVDDPRSQPTGVYCCNAQGLPLSVASYIPGVTTTTAPDRRTTNIKPIFQVESDAVQLTAAWDLDFATLTSYSQYRDELGTTTLDLEVSSAPLADFRFPYADKIITQELILSSDAGSRLQWTLGGFYFQDKARSDLDVSTAGAPFAIDVIRAIVTVESLAAYADATYEVANNLFLTGGVRWSEDQYKDPYNLFGPDPNAVRATLDPITDKTVTPRVVVRYQIDDGSSVYASFNRGYKSALRNLPAADNTLVKPEKMSAYEVGYKYAGRGFSSNVAAYYYDYKNLQVSSYRNALSITNNAATSRIYGVDGDLSYTFSPHFQVSGGAAYTDAKYEKYVNSPIYEQCLDLAACGAAFGTFPTASATLYDKTMQFAPEFSGHLSAQYTAALLGGELNLSGTLSYASKQYFDSSEQFHDDGHEKLILRAQWTDASDRYTVAVYGDNLTDSRYLVQVIPQAVAIPVSWNEPRTVGVSLGVKF